MLDSCLSVVPLALPDWMQVLLLWPTSLQLEQMYFFFLVAFCDLASPPEAQVTDLLVGFLLLSLPGKFTIKFTEKNKINLRNGQHCADISQRSGW